ncbi:MAG: protein phosphatase 2C domain-containing protein [Myxococcota bacterium]
MQPIAPPFRGHGETRRGRREHDDDAVLVAPGLGLFAVADGSGASGAGREASQLAIATLVASFTADAAAHAEAPAFDALGLAAGARRLSRAVHAAHREVQGLHTDARPLGATLVALYLEPERGFVHVAHVGNCRAYRRRGRHLEALTDDHTLAREVLEAAPSAPLDAAPGTLTRAVGMAGDLRVTLRSHALASGDRFLLCSDGLNALLDEEQLAAALEQAMRPEALVRLLFEVAGAEAGDDNAAALVLDLDLLDEDALPGPPAAAAAARPWIRRAHPSVPLRPVRREDTQWHEAAGPGAGWEDDTEPSDDEPTDVDLDAHSP